MPKLGRVNLIVGKNNVGKTTLLEAIRLYASMGSLQEIAKILSSLNDNREPISRDEAIRNSDRDPILRISFGRPR